MIDEHEFRPRPGRIRHGGSQDGKSFVGQVCAAARKAGLASGGLGDGRPSASSVFGRGRAASLNALRRVGGRTRRAVVKVRVVRHAAAAPLGVHIKYLQRDGVDRNDTPGRLFDAQTDGADSKAFAERCAGDRHHFRFIISPPDAAELADLKAYARELLDQAEHDLGTRLDWVAVDHWNTAHPHIHVLVRGRGEDGRDLVISRDYISNGLRARASDLATLELGPRTDQEIRRGLQTQVEAERWTDLDRDLARDATETGGVIDLRRPILDPGDTLRSLKIARLGKLERLGLAEPAGRGRWRLSPDADTTLRALARRGDIIARIHQALAEQGMSRGAETWRPDTEAGAPVLGRLIGRGLDDELKGTAFAVIDGVDGRTHHLGLPSLEAASDAPVGAVVEARWIDGHRGPVAVLAVRSDLALAQQVTANGATWLDRQLVGRAPAPLAEAGFGVEVRGALSQRADWLATQRLARRDGRRLVFAQDLIETLRRRDLAAATAKIAADTGLDHRPATTGETISGVVRRRVTLASGRFAMIDDGLGFSLVPWRAELERGLGQSVSGLAMPGGGIDWTRGRGLGR
jgi:type IV secretory pathway VirD2 relaxase